jgi:hypothetical protein
MSDLALKYEDIAAAVGRFLGYGRGVVFGEKAWNAKQQADIDDCIRIGYTRFLRPTPVGGASYNWSFLAPTGSVSTVSGNATVPLMHDFGGLEGLVVVTGGGTLHQSPEYLVRKLHADNTSARGSPMYFCLLTDKAATPLHPQRHSFLVYPTPDAVYTMTFRYYHNPAALTTPKPYALGGPEHSETVLASCIAVAEETMDDQRGVRYQAFVERLAASISFDRHRKPKNLGYNGDKSDQLNLRSGPHTNRFTITLEQT